MSDIKDSTTLFYNLKLKRTREPVEVFEKMAKSLKKSGAAKKWICEYSAEGSLSIFVTDTLYQRYIVYGLT